MTDRALSRRELILGTGALLGAAVLPRTAAAQERPKDEPFGYCLNTGTISGFKLPLPQVIDLVAEAGYQALEPWVGNLDQFVKGGGSLKDIEKRLRDRGITVESAVGFPEWIVDDDARRAKGMETMKRDMDLVAQIGGKRIAAPPAGAYDTPAIEVARAAERYRAVCELGDKMGVVPQVEFWGGAKNNLRQLSQAVAVAAGSGHPRACIIPDIYHMYKGESDLDGLRNLGGVKVHVLHANDYPADPPREKIGDGHRVYPGDGVAPITRILRDLHASGFRGFLSLELFNREYWKTDAPTVARTGIGKMRSVVRKAFA
jgi:sugar phosphate isomerase/epimerase